MVKANGEHTMRRTPHPIRAVGRTLAGATLVAVGVGPTLALNTWPRVSQIAAGAVDPGALAIVAFQAASVLVMAATPFAMKRTEYWWGKLGFLLIGLVLAVLNWGAGTEAASHLRDTIADPRRATIARAATLERDLGLARKSRIEVSHFVPTVAEGVAAAQRAVDEAIVARDQECGKVGENCRRRVAELAERHSELAKVHTNKAFTDQAASLDAKITGIEAEIRALGAIPTHADPGAARIAKVVGKVINLGDKPEDVISDWWPTVLAAGAELLGMWGPRILVLGSLGNETLVARRGHTHPPVWRRRKSAKPNEAAVGARVFARVVTRGDVQEFLKARTVTRPGHRVRCGKVYESYRGWCAEQEIEPLSLTRFGTAIAAAGISRDSRNNRSSYLDITLVGAPLKVVASQQ
jgi:hypothetical protein